jgi:hypothetical protein
LGSIGPRRTQWRTEVATAKRTKTKVRAPTDVLARRLALLLGRFGPLADVALADDAIVVLEAVGRALDAKNERALRKLRTVAVELESVLPKTRSTPSFLAKHDAVLIFEGATAKTFASEYAQVRVVARYVNDLIQRGVTRERVARALEKTVRLPPLLGHVAWVTSARHPLAPIVERLPVDVRGNVVPLPVDRLRTLVTKALRSMGVTASRMREPFGREAKQRKRRTGRA